MKRRAFIAALSVTLALAAWGVALAVETAQPAVVIKGPTNGEKLEGAIVPEYVELKGLTGGRYVVEVGCGVYAHHFIVDPADPWTGPGGNYVIVAPFAIVQKGPNQLSVEVKSEDGTKTFAQACVSFEVIDVSDAKKLERLRWAYDRLMRPSSELSGVRDAYRLMRFNLATNPKADQAPLKERADRLVSARNREFIERIGALSMLSEYHEMCFQPGDALRALKAAEQTYMEGKASTESGPYVDNQPPVYPPDYPSWAPEYMDGLAKFYARRMALSRSVDYLKQAAGWYENQATHFASNKAAQSEAKNRAAAIYRRIAHYSFMLDKDMGAYNTWMERFRLTLPQDRATPNRADFFSIIRGQY